MRQLRHRRLLVSILCLLGFICTSRLASAATKKKASSESAQQKRLNHLAARGPVVPLSASNFSRYAEGSRTSRPYHVVVLFTSSSPEHKCVVCRSVETVFSEVARAYTQQQQQLKQSLGGQSHAETPLIFALVDAASAFNTFVEYQMNSAPHAYVILMGKNLPTGQGKDDMEVTRSLSTGRADARAISFASDVTKATGIEIVVLPDTSSLIPSAVALGIILGFVARFFARVPSRIIATIRCTGVWMTASTACYMVGVGGMIYCIIRNPHFHGFDPQTRTTVIFSQGGRDQFWYEGVVVAFMNLAMAFAIVGVYNAAGWKRAPWLVRNLAVLACITALCYVSKEFFKLYVSKTPWYSFQQMLPQKVTEFHSIKLKRGHGLLRRLVRLSHLWLNEFTTMEAFMDKFKTHLLDFIVRKTKSSMGT